MVGRPFRRVCAIGIPDTDPLMRKPRFVVTKTVYSDTARSLYAKAMRVPVEYVCTYPCHSRLGWIAKRYPPICQEPGMGRIMDTLDADE